MSKTHQSAVQKQFTSTVEAFSISAVRDGPEVLKEKVEFARPRPEDSALDVACGPGAFVLAFASRVRFARGIDLTEAMVRQARVFQQQAGIANAAFDQGEAEQLPYPASTFDLVSCQCSIHHLPRPELALSEMLRALKPEGRLVVIDTLAPEHDAKFELHNRIERLRDPSHTLSLRWTTFRSLFDELDLRIVDEKMRRRRRSFNQWMLRAGLEPRSARYRKVRRLLEETIACDSAGFAAETQGDDIEFIHNEGMFLLERAHSAPGPAPA